MQYLSGREALRRAAASGKRMETERGMIIFPEDVCLRGEEISGRLHERLPEFYPATPEEAYLMAESARLYADTYGTPILVRLSREVAEGRMFLGAEERQRRGRRKKRCECGGRRPGAVPCRAFSDSGWNCRTGRGERGIIVCGPAALRVREILNGCREVQVLKLGTVWPLPEELIRDFLRGLSAALILDETRAELLTQIYAVKGKYELSCRIEPFYGEEERSDDIAGAMTALVGKRGSESFLSVVPPVERSLCGMPVLPC